MPEVGTKEKLRLAWVCGWVGGWVVVVIHCRLLQAWVIKLLGIFFFCRTTKPQNVGTFYQKPEYFFLQPKIDSTGKRNQCRSKVVKVLPKCAATASKCNLLHHWESHKKNNLWAFLHCLGAWVPQKSTKNGKLFLPPLGVEKRQKKPKSSQPTPSPNDFHLVPIFPPPTMPSYPLALL